MLVTTEITNMKLFMTFVVYNFRPTSLNIGCGENDTLEKLLYLDGELISQLSANFSVGHFFSYLKLKV